MRATPSLLAAATLAAAHPAHAQQCTPFWTSASTFGSWTTAYFHFETPQGDVLYAARESPNRLYRFTGSDWQEVELTGFPPGSWGLKLLWMDAGQGHKLFVISRLSGSNYATFYQDAGVWVPMPPHFANSKSDPIGCADFGTGPLIYSRHVHPLTGQVGIAWWDGQDWVRIADASYSWIQVLEHEGGVYFVGNFNTLNGQTVNGIAQWDGQQWSRPWPSLRYFLGGRVHMVEFDDGAGPATYLSNLIDPADPAASVWKWNGSEWELFGRGGTGGFIDGLTVFDDGRGPALYISGFFSHFNGFYSPKMVRWDGQNYEAVPTPPTAFNTFAVDTDQGKALFVWAPDHYVGPGYVNSAAFYVGCPNCYANCDLSTTAPALNIADFSCFLQKFALKDPYANCTVDAAIDVADFQCFLAKFIAGCP